jgi:hypothetical protein
MVFISINIVNLNVIGKQICKRYILPSHQRRQRVKSPRKPNSFWTSTFSDPSPPANFLRSTGMMLKQLVIELKTPDYELNIEVQLLTSEETI